MNDPFQEVHKAIETFISHRIPESGLKTPESFARYILCVEEFAKRVSISVELSAPANSDPVSYHVSSTRSFDGFFAQDPSAQFFIRRK
mgnify:CR=1 FL=1